MGVVQVVGEVGQPAGRGGHVVDVQRTLVVVVVVVEELRNQEIQGALVMAAVAVAPPSGGVQPDDVVGRDEVARGRVGIGRARLFLRP